MIDHNTIRDALIATLRGDIDLSAAVNSAGWYRLVLPRAIRSPAILVGGIKQPLTGVTGASRRQTRYDKPIEISVMVYCERHDMISGDGELSSITNQVYDVISANDTLGIDGFRARVMEIRSDRNDELGTNVIQSELILHCNYDEEVI